MEVKWEPAAIGDLSPTYPPESEVMKANHSNFKA